MFLTLSTLAVNAVSTAIGIALGTIIYRRWFKKTISVAFIIPHTIKAKRKPPYNR